MNSWTILFCYIVQTFLAFHIFIPLSYYWISYIPFHLKCDQIVSNILCIPPLHLFLTSHVSLSIANSTFLSEIPLIIASCQFYMPIRQLLIPIVYSIWISHELLFTWWICCLASHQLKCISCRESAFLSQINKEIWKKENHCIRVLWGPCSSL